MALTPWGIILSRLLGGDDEDNDEDEGGDDEDNYEDESWNRDRESNRRFGQEEGVYSDLEKDEDDGSFLTNLVIFSALTAFFGKLLSNPKLLLGVVVFLVVAGGILVSAIGGAIGALAGPAGAIADPFISWGGYLGEQAGLSVQGTGILDPVSQKINSGISYVSCLAAGPGCYRQRQLNQTQRPSSEQVGETYLLKVDEFSVGGGASFDVAFKDLDQNIGSSFSLSNTRRGLRGIVAYNTSYRLRMKDLDETYCKFNWLPIESGTDLDGDGNFNDVLPGQGVSKFIQEDSFNIRNCELKQPSLGVTRNVFLDIKYNYSSQATLQVDAVAQDVVQNNPEIKQEDTKSTTADTPVTSAVRVQEPIEIDTDGSSNILLKASLNTDEPEDELEYKIHDIEVTTSDFVQKKSEGSCQFKENGNKLTLKDEVKEENTEKANGEKRWFTGKGPVFRCNMETTGTEDLNPRGETLTFGVDSNYTVKSSEGIQSFKALNTRCSNPGIECPILVTESYDQNMDSYDWKTNCKGVDASYQGCSAVKGDPWVNEANLNRTDFGGIGQEVSGTNFREEGYLTDPESLSEGEEAYKLSRILEDYFGGYESSEEGDGESEDSEALIREGVNQEWIDELSKVGRSPKNVSLGLDPNAKFELLNAKAGVADGGKALVAEGSGKVVFIPERVCNFQELNNNVIAILHHPDAIDYCSEEELDDGEELSAGDIEDTGDETLVFYQVCEEDGGNQDDSTGPKGGGAGESSESTDSETCGDQKTFSRGSGPEDVNVCDEESMKELIVDDDGEVENKGQISVNEWVWAEECSNGNSNGN